MTGADARMIVGAATLILTVACGGRDEPTTAGASVPEIEMSKCRFEAFDRLLGEIPEGEDLGVGSEAGDALCGTLEVWEKRDAQSGRRIGLNVVVLPATGENPEPDPLFLFAGGPGEAVSSWGWVVPGLAAARERRAAAGPAHDRALR